MRVNRYIHLFALAVLGQSMVLLQAAPARTATAGKAIQALRAGGEYDTLRTAYSAARHRVQAEGNGFRIENPENQFEAQFDRKGVTGAHAGGTFRLQFTGYGYGQDLARPAAGAMAAHDTTIEYQRGAVTEWYRNEAGGLEQGFTFSRPPAGMKGGPLTLEIGVSGALRPILRGSEVRLERDGREVLAYTGLRAWDSTGKALPARMDVAESRIRLLVTDASAVYPITVDPLIQQQLSAPDAAAGDYFGDSVALNGNTAIVGAPIKTISGHSHQGAAYVFVHNANSWTLQQELVASDGTADDQFGFSVSVSGDTAVVGAWGKTVGNNSVQGVAYVFARSGSTWTQTAELTASDPAAQDDFGWSVSVSGTTAAVAAPNKAQQHGAVYVFVNNGASWVQQAKLTSSDAQIGDRFGYSISLDTDTLVAGAPSKSPAGAVYAFVRSGGSWSQQQEIVSPVAATAEQFGYSVAVSGNTALVGAYGDQSNTGAAFVFVRSGSTWGQTQKLTASDAAAADWFGYSVALNGTSAVIGAPNKTVGGVTQRGAAYLFSSNGSAFVQQQELTASDGGQTDFYGLSTAVYSGTPLVGAPGKSGGSYTGGAYVYVTLSAPLPVPGDFDGNRVPDLVWQNESTRQVVLDYYGGPGGASNLGWAWLYPSNGAAGWHVVAIADFNGDGQPDLVWQNDATSQVTVHYYGGTGGASDLGWNWLYQSTAAAGWHIVAAADFNGDGTPDLVWQSDSTRQVVVDYYGGPGGATVLGWAWLYPGTGAAGWHVRAAADFNGDGVPDLVWQNDNTSQVTVHYYGGAGGSTDLGWNWLYPTTGAVGWHVAKVADFNGDGVPDLVWENNSTGQTTVHYYGGPGGATDLGWNWLYSGSVPGWSIK